MINQGYFIRGIAILAICMIFQDGVYCGELLENALPEEGQWEVEKISRTVFPLLSFEEAKDEVYKGVADPRNKIPFKIRLASKGIMLLVTRPDNEYLRAFWAALLQTSAYGLKCSDAYRTLRKMDSASQKRGPVELLQSIRNSGLWCTHVISTFLSQAIDQFKVKYVSPTGLIDGVSIQEGINFMEQIRHFVHALQKRVVAKTYFYETLLTPQKFSNIHRLEILREAKERDFEYEESKYDTYMAMSRAETHSLIPRVCSLLKSVSTVPTARPLRSKL